MPPRTRKAPAPAVVAEKAPAAVFTYEQLVTLPADLPGPDTAAVLAAQQAGHRLTGSPAVASTTDQGVHVLVAWSVPIEK